MSSSYKHQLWPANITEFTRQLVPGSFKKFTGGGLRSLKVSSFAGNVAVAFLPRYQPQSEEERAMYGDSGEGEDPLDAIVATGLTEDGFLPDISMRGSHLSVSLGAVSVLSTLARYRQTQKINTLVLLPLPTPIETIDLKLTLGDVWVLGSPLFSADCSASSIIRSGYSSGSSFSVPQRISASVNAGDVNVIDCFAKQIVAKNNLGDVNVAWSLAPEGKALSKQETCDEEMPALVQEVSASTTVGSARVNVSGCKSLPAWLGHAKNTHAQLLDGEADAGSSKKKTKRPLDAIDLRKKWIFGEKLAKSFTRVKSRYAQEN